MASLAILAGGEDGSGSEDLPLTTEVPSVQVPSTPAAPAAEMTIDAASRRRPVCHAEVNSLLNTVIAIVQNSYKTMKDPCTPPTVFGLCYAEPLATEVLLIVAASIILIAMAMATPWLWAQVSSMLHQNQMKKEEREVRLNHEEEMLKGIRFEELRRAEERLERLERLSRPAERTRMSNTTFPRTHRMTSSLSRLSEETEERNPLAIANSSYERDFARELTRRLSTEALASERNREMDRPVRITTTNRPRPQTLYVRSSYPSAASFPN